MVDVLCFDSTYNCCLHHLEQEKWNRYAFEYNKHNSVLYRIIYLLPIQTHIAGNWKWYHHWCSYYPSGLWIEHYGQYKLLFHINRMLYLISTYNLRNENRYYYIERYIIKIIIILTYDEHIREQKFTYGNNTWMIKWESHQGSSK